ncbi:MAG: tRNA (adenine-N1)-methyltransferase [Dehalococcoidia bacterium]|nr:tRNA (adenine-N1)-methyltransferase [Dehalococcoidia bacterium]
MSAGPSPLREGEIAMLIDNKSRRYHLFLKAGRQFHTHQGIIPHGSIIGREEGSRLVSAEGAEFMLLRPATADFVVRMKRPTNILYPKDLGIITALTGIGAGSTVVEAGTGSGSGTIALLRAVGEKGRVLSYEIREEFVANALSNIRAMFAGELPAWLTLVNANICDGIDGSGVDACLLDLPEPWRAVEAAVAALRPGGFFVSYIPTTIQLQQSVMALEASGRFTAISSVEVMLRGWDVSERSVRPSHRMVGHTGFITFARLCEPPLPVRSAESRKG